MSNQPIAATLLRCKLKSFIARITTHLKHCHATKCRCCKLKLNWRLFFSKFFSTCFKFFSKCLRRVVIRATTLFNVQRNNVALQVEEICFPYYRAVSCIKDRRA